MANQFEKIPTTLDDVFVLKRFTHADERGIFTKTYNSKMFDELNLGESIEIRESLCSISKKNVIRGMHYQTAPYGCAKIVSVVKGEIIDVIVGVGGASNERNKGKFFSVNLSDRNRKSLFVPNGYAHGFLVLSEEAVVVYHQTNHFDAASDTGIHFDSFGFQWPVQSPIISEKDAALPGLNEVL